MEVQTLNELTPLLSNVGFPIFVAWYMLTKFEKTINAMTEALNNNTKVIEGLKESIRKEE